MSDKESFKNDLSELSADSIDIAIDLLTESELFEDVPVAGMLLKIGKAISSIPDIIFLQKLGVFIKAVNDKTKHEERALFAKEIKYDKNKRDKLYSAIFLKLDKFDDMTKPDLFAKIFSCFITSRIAEQEYLTLSSALNLASLESLKDFSYSYWINKGYLSDRVFRFPKSSRMNYGNLLTTSFVTFSVDENFRRKKSPGSFALEAFPELNFNITLLGHLYAYITDDLENYFFLKEDVNRSSNISNDRQYEFELPNLNEALNREIQQKLRSQN